MARNKYPEETVKLILDVSTKMFCEKGYDNTSLQDIINETKLSKGAIYHHFDSKEDILKAIFQRIGNENSTSCTVRPSDRRYTCPGTASSPRPIFSSQATGLNWDWFCSSRR